MQYMKLFKSIDNNRVNEHTPANWTEEYFKDKIDWKFFNYLIDRFTTYEDRGYKVYINVCTKHVLSKYNVVYFDVYSYPVQIYIDSEFNSKVDSYKTNGLFYMIRIDDGIDRVDVRELYNCVYSKCDRIEYKSSKLGNSRLIIKPKGN